MVSGLAALLGVTAVMWDDWNGMSWMAQQISLVSDETATS